MPNLNRTFINDDKKVLSEAEVREIRTRSTESIKVLAEEFQVHASTISSIVNYQTWVYLDQAAANDAINTAPTRASKKRKLDDDAVLDILTSPEATKTLAELYDVSTVTIGHVRAGRYYREVRINENKIVD